MITNYVKTSKSSNFSNPYTNRRRSGVFIVNFEHILHLVLVFLLLTLNMQLFAVIAC